MVTALLSKGLSGKRAFFELYFTATLTQQPPGMLVSYITEVFVVLTQPAKMAKILLTLTFCLTASVTFLTISYP